MLIMMMMLMMMKMMMIKMMIIMMIMTMSPSHFLVAVSCWRRQTQGIFKLALRNPAPDYSNVPNSYQAKRPYTENMVAVTTMMMYMATTIIRKAMYTMMMMDTRR